MKCDNCGCTKTNIKKHTHNYIIKGYEISFKSDRRFCSNCNNLVYDEELDNIASKKTIEIYNSKYGIPKEEIINLRKSYNLSQELFAKIIGCAKKTLISYEKGTSIPNDNYYIILKSLISRPEFLTVLVDSNKEQFTNEEYLKIQNKLVPIFGTDFLWVLKKEIKPTEYNGYTLLNNDKILNIILFFAEKGIQKTKLLKEMFYADFLMFKEVGASITGLEYVKINYGPVPDNFETIISNCVAKDKLSYTVKYNNEYECHILDSKAKADLSVFNSEEIKVIKRVQKFFEKFSSRKIADFSHEEDAYIKTKFQEKINYDFAFNIDLENR